LHKFGHREHHGFFGYQYHFEGCDLVLM